MENCIYCGKELTDFQIKKHNKCCSRSCAQKLRCSSIEERQKRSIKMKKTYENKDLRALVSFKTKEAMSTKEIKEKHLNAIKEYNSKESSKLKKSSTMKDNWKNSFYREKTAKAIKSSKNTIEQKRICSENTKKLWLDKSYKENHCIKSSKTMKLKWQNDKYIEKQKLARSLDNYKFKISNSMKVVLNTKIIKEKLSQNSKLNWKNKIFRDKIYQTKKKNHSFNTSKPEQLTKELLQQKFDKVLTQYKDPRYQYLCDFYVPQLDLFIECNYHWTHGKEPYDENNTEHQNILKLWKSKNTKFYDNAIDTWTKRDVEKLECFKKNNLNYKIFYSFEEFLDWFNVIL